MLIGIDAREIQDGIFTGIGRALSVFLEYFSRQNDNNTCILFSSKPIPKECVGFSSRIHAIVKKEKYMWLWDQTTLLHLIKKNKIDLFYSPYYKIPVLCPCPCVSAIFDLMYVYCEYYKRELSFLSLLYLKTFGWLMAHRADAIFTCSEYSKSEIIRFYGVKPGKIEVIYLGLDDIYKSVCDPDQIKTTKKKFNIDSDFILYTGNFKPHKNVETLIYAFDIVVKEFPDIKLVLSGAQKRHAKIIEELISSCQCKNNIIITGDIPIQDQVILYSAAKVFVMPSLYEGFGYPPLEAMACGTPVISSILTSLSEIVGDAGIRVDTRNQKQIAEKIIEVLKSPELASCLAKRGLEWSQQFTSTKYAKQLYELLLTTYNSSL